MALVLVLGALTILTIMLTDFQDENSAELGSALSARDALRAEFAARSGIALSRLLIASEPTIRKGLAFLGFLTGGSVGQIPVWNFADQVLGAFNDAAGAQRFAQLTGTPIEKLEKLGIKGARFELSIIDEDSKLNLNSGRELFTQTRLTGAIMGLIGPPQYEAMFSGRDGDGQFSDRQTVCGAILDWVDNNQDLSRCDLRASSGPSSGAEDSFYQLLDPPYYRKNAAFDSLEELRMVRGITDDFWSTFVEPDAKDPRKRIVTVWGAQGKVNINSANAQTMLALICGPGGAVQPAKICVDPMESSKFLMLVNLVQSFAPGAPIFGSPRVFVNALKQQDKMIGPLLKTFGMEPVTFMSEADFQKSLTVESKVFTLMSTGVVKSGDRETKVRIRSVVDFRDAPAPAQLLANSIGIAAGAASAGGGLPGMPGLGSAGLPGLGGIGALPTSSATAGLPFAGFTPGALPSGMPSGATADGNLSFLMPNPGGRVIYYRID